MTRRNRKTITKTLVDNLKPGQIVWDEKLRGFGVRCQIKDKSFVLKCSIKGRQRFVTIGKFGAAWTVETARKEAVSILTDLHRGIDPIENRKNARSHIKIDELCARYLREHAIPHKKPSSSYTDQRIIENHVIPLLGNKLVGLISKSEIEQFRNAVLVGKTAPANPRSKQLTQRGGQPVRGGPGVANRCLTLLSKMFNLAEEWGLRRDHSNPVRKVQRYREQPCNRFLSTDELRRLGHVLSVLEASRKEDPFVIGALRLLIYSGARSGEVLSLRWEWVHLDRSLILLPDSKTGQKPILLSSPALRLLESLPRVAGNPFVFVGNKRGRHLVNIQKPWGRIRTQAGISDVRIHDLRHTFASMAAGKGFSLPVIGGLLGHSSSPVGGARLLLAIMDNPRTPDLILGKALRGRLGHQITGATARPFLHLLNPTRRLGRYRGLLD